MITIVEALGHYKNSDNEIIGITQVSDIDFQIVYSSEKTEDISTVGHFDGWWSTTNGSIKFFDGFLLLSQEGQMIGKNAMRWNKTYNS